MSKTDNIYVDTAVLDPNKKFVNGPVNVARLEGKVNGIKKVIYLFMDIHLNITQQLECSNIHSQNINSYLLNNFMKLRDSGKTYDIFLEEYFSTALNKEVASGRRMYNVTKNQYIDKYIFQVLLMFKKMFNYSQEVNKVFKTPILDNVRIHYIDPRNIFISPDGIYLLSYDFQNLLADVTDTTGYKAYDTKQYIINIKIQLEHFQQMINECLNKENMCNVPNIVFGGIRTPENYDAYVKHIFHKMLYRYNHKHIQKILVSYLTTELNKITKIIAYLNKLYDTFEKLNNEYVSKYHHIKNPKFYIDNQYDYGDPYYISELNKIETYEKPLLEIASKISNLIKGGIMYMDIFFLRRFLDKDYITNTIAYTGGGHSANYISILIQKFGFKITHMATSNNLSVSELNNKIKKAKHIEEVEYLIFPKVLQQCSDLTNFPENFE